MSIFLNKDGYIKTDNFKLIVRMISILSISLSILFLSIIYLTDYQTPETYVIHWIVAVFSLVLVTSLISNSDFYSAIAFSFLTPFWYSIGSIIVGTGIEAGTAAMVNVAAAFVFYDKYPRLKVFAIVWGLVIFVSSLIYIEFYGPLYPEVNKIPVLRLAILAVCTVIIGSVILLYSIQNRRLIESLESNNSELEEVKSELESFSYMASHDLQAPLRNINGFINLAQRRVESGDIDEAKEFLSLSKEGSQKLSNLLKDMLAINRIGKVKSKESIHLNALFREARIQLLSEFPTSSITADKLPSYLCNRTELYLLFSNIMKNGLKYNRTNNPAVHLAYRRKSASIHLIFTDNGIGISDEEQMKIFNYFHRSNKIHTEGSGLGLGICKKIVDVYSGQIKIHSTLDRGSTFTIILPIEGVENSVQSYTELLQV